MSDRNDFWAQIENLQRHPAYLTGHQTDPVRGLLAAVVLRVILDINPNRRIKAYYRETARQFLIDSGTGTEDGAQFSFVICGFKFLVLSKPIDKRILS